LTKTCAFGDRVVEAEKALEPEHPFVFVEPKSAGLKAGEICPDTAADRGRQPVANAKRLAISVNLLDSPAEATGVPPMVKSCSRSLHTHKNEGRLLSRPSSPHGG
jgi:hypothetical protein